MEPGALLNAWISLDREPHARARMNDNLQTKISRGMSLSERPSSLVNGGFSSCHRTKLMSNFGRTRVFLGFSISKVRKQFLMITLSEMSGFVCISTESMAALCTLIVAGNAPLSNIEIRYSATVTSVHSSG